MPPPEPSAAADHEALRRRYMLAAIRLVQPADPARLNDRELFDLFAMIGEPDFAHWQQHIAEWDRWQRSLSLTAVGRETDDATAEALSDEPLSHREFDAQLRRQRG